MVKNWEEHITLDKAWGVIREHLKKRPLEKETILLSESDGRILASDVIAQRNIPHFNASAVDGYAVKSEATAHASAAIPSVFEGDSFQWLNTGMPVPSQYDSVLMLEDASLNTDGRLLAAKALTSGENIRPIGEDIAHSQVAAKQGDLVTPALASLLLALKIPELDVYRLPRTLYVPTGDEIVPAQEWLGSSVSEEGKIAESNSTMIAGYFKAWQYPICCAERVADDPDQLNTILQKASSEYDLILIGAGSSKGEKDFSASVLEKQGQIFFHWLLMKPGRPALVGKIGNAYVVNLPGFPMSTAVVLWSLVYPLLQCLYRGDFDTQSVLAEAVLSKESMDVALLLPHSSPPGKKEWLRLKAVELGGQKVTFPLPSGSSTMWAIAEADGFALIDEADVELPKGTKIHVWFNKKIEWDKRILFQGSNDPAFELLGSPIRKHGGELITRSVGSLGGLAALARAECHVASCHLLDAEAGLYNDSFIKRLSGSQKWNRILLYKREQGIVVKKGNPKGIQDINDLAGGEVRIVNRQPGAGTRVLLDYLLKERNIDPASVTGYTQQAITHFEAANRIAAGLADATLAIRVAADSLGLDFIPLTLEPYELIIPEEFMQRVGIVALLNAVQDKNWRRTVENMGGYQWSLEAS